LRIYNFGKETGTEITNFNSRETIFTKIIKHNKSIHIGCIFIGQEGIVGLHKATINQLFLVVNGEGWVTGKEGVRYNIKHGNAAYWEPGEIHESGSEKGMTVIVIESDDLEPLMNEIKWIEG
jgi:quercetin dioxygenase-like cupin family protein